MTAPRLAIAGIYGHGHTHVEHALQLEAEGKLILAATIDLKPRDDSFALTHPVPHYASLEECVESGEPIDVVILCTPINTHVELTEYALRHGLDVLLEKPTTVSLETSQQLAALAAETGRLVQVGFQSLGSHAIAGVRDLIAGGRIGTLTGASIVGQWVRNDDYWNRAAWAGRREMNGVPTVDGVVTNPLAHSFATALAILGQDREGGVTDVVLDQYHANGIEADDTSAVRIHTESGVELTAALTLCGPARIEPVVRLHGTEGSIWLWYTEDRAEIRDAGGRVAERVTFERTALLDQLLEVRERGGGNDELLVPLEATFGFMAILDAVRNADDPSQVPDAYVDWRDDWQGHHPVVRDIDQWVWRVADEGRTFLELGAPFAVAAHEA